MERKKERKGKEKGKDLSTSNAKTVSQRTWASPTQKLSNAPVQEINNHELIKRRKKKRKKEEKERESRTQLTLFPQPFFFSPNTS